MNIRKSSRMYKYLSFLDSIYMLDSKLTKAKSLCPLFWKTIACTIGLPIMLLLNLIFEIICRMPSISDSSANKIANFITLTAVIFLLFMFCKQPIIIPVFIMGILIAIILTLLVIGVGIFSNWLFVKYIPSKAETIKVKDTSVKDFVVEGVSSIKNKVCPLVYFIDDNEEHQEDLIEL